MIGPPKCLQSLKRLRLKETLCVMVLSYSVYLHINEEYSSFCLTLNWIVHLRKTNKHVICKNFITLQPNMPLSKQKHQWMAKIRLKNVTWIMFLSVQAHAPATF